MFKLCPQVNDCAFGSRFGFIVSVDQAVGNWNRAREQGVSAGPRRRRTRSTGRDKTSMTRRAVAGPRRLDQV